MHLFSEKVAVLLIASSIACHEATGPIDGPVSGRYVLETIDGRPLPTFIAVIPAGGTTVFSSSVTLDKAGKAVIIEHRHSDFLGENREWTDTSTFDYRIHDGLIEIGSFSSCPINTECAPSRTGTISGAELNLVFGRINDLKIMGRYRATSDD